MQPACRGRPSRGCNKCRQRKVKCDERQPSCDRCAKGGFECVYRDEFDLLLRNQTSETAAKAQKKWRSRAKKTSPLLSPASILSPSSPSSSGSVSPRSKQIQHVANIPPSVSLDQSICELAEKRFMFDFIVEAAPQAPRQGYSTFIPEIVEKMEPGTGIYHAFRATSLANFAARSKSPHAVDMGWNEYGKAIKLLSPDISDPYNAKPLDTLSATCMLSLYEILAAPYLTRGGSWQAHVNGSTAILNSFYASGYGSPEEHETLGELFQHIITQMLINCMTFSKRPEIPLNTVEVFIRPKTVMHQVFSMIYKSAEKLAVWHETELSVTDPAMVNLAAMKMVSDCDELEIEMDNWFADRPPIWKEETQEVGAEHMPAWLQNIYREHGAPTTMRVASNLLIAQRYNLTRGTRIQTHCHALNALDVLIASAHTGAELAFWLETQHRFELRVMHHIENALASIYGHMTLPMRGQTVQKSLDDVPTQRVMLLLWPLYRGCILMMRRDTLSQMDFNGRRFWARSLLCWIRDEVGIKKCEAFVNNIDGNPALAFSLDS